jgi:hypothetical protein
MGNLTGLWDSMNYHALGVSERFLHNTCCDHVNKSVCWIGKILWSLETSNQG